MNRKLPVKLYSSFIDTYEAAVMKAQDAIRKIERLEQPYNIVAGALDRHWKAPNDLKLTVEGDHIELRITALESDRSELFYDLIDAIGDGLKQAGIHRDGKPSKSDGGYSPIIARSFKGKAANGCAYGIWVFVDVPFDGIADLEVEAKIHSYQTRIYTIKKREHLKAITARTT